MNENTKNFMSETHQPLTVNFIAANLSRVSMGVFEVTRQLGLNLREKGHQINVFGLADEHTEADLPKWNPLQPKSFAPAQPKPLGYSRSYLNALLSTDADIAHLHVIWMYQSAMAYKWHKRFQKPFITTVNGMLDPWAVKNSKFKKKLAYHWYEKSAFSACSCFHVNTVKEYESLRSFGLKNPIAIINNGVSLPDRNKSFKAAPWGNQFAGKKVLLYLSRVHPKKGLANLIDAIAALKKESDPTLNNWVLAIVGCAEGGEHEKQLATQVEQHGLQQYVHFFGQFFHEDMEACYYHSDAYILPSYSEGVPMAALSAWAFGKYSLLTPECNLVEGFDAGASLRIETNPHSIKSGLQTLFSKTDEELNQLGAGAFEFVNRMFSWQEMARKMSEVYYWVTKKGPRPETIILD